MVQGLRSNAEVQVIRFNTFPGAGEETLDLAARAFGGALDPSIAAFFRETDGLQFMWQSKRGEFHEPDNERHVFTEEPAEWESHDREDIPCDGAVMIPPLSLILSRDWAESLYFDFMKGMKQDFTFGCGSMDAYEYAKCIRPFDWAVPFYDVGFWVGPRPDPNPVVIFGSDHMASWDDSYCTDFHSYLECVLASKGNAKRVQSFYRGGYRIHENTPRLLTPAAYCKPLCGFVALACSHPAGPSSHRPVARAGRH